MEVYVLHRNSVGLRLRLCKHFKDSQGKLPCAERHLSPVNDFADFLYSPVNMPVSVMIVGMCFLCRMLLFLMGTSVFTASGFTVEMLLPLMSMEISHIVIMVILLQHHIKVTGIDSGF